MHQIDALLESALVGVESPVARIVAIKVKPRHAIGRIPLDLRVISGDIAVDFLLSDVLRGGIRFFILPWIASVPVISVDRNSHREFFFGDELQCVLDILNRPRIARDRPRHSPARVLVVGHEADQIGTLRQGFQIEGASPVRVQPV